MKKKCSKCKLLRSLDNFNKSKKTYDGLDQQCKKCTKKRSERYYSNEKNKDKRNLASLEWRREHPEYDKNNKLKRLFGITIDEFQEILIKQNKTCAICKDQEPGIDPRTGKRKSLAVDHCHKTGKIRGLLCWPCNSGIGKLKENIDILQNAINYLKKS